MNRKLTNKYFLIKIFVLLILPFSILFGKVSIGFAEDEESMKGFEIENIQDYTDEDGYIQFSATGQPVKPKVTQKQAAPMSSDNNAATRLFDWNNWQNDPILRFKYTPLYGQTSEPNGDRIAPGYGVNRTVHNEVFVDSIGATVGRWEDYGRANGDMKRNVIKHAKTMQVAVRDGKKWNQESLPKNAKYGTGKWLESTETRNTAYWTTDTEKNVRYDSYYGYSIGAFFNSPKANPGNLPPVNGLYKNDFDKFLDDGVEVTPLTYDFTTNYTPRVVTSVNYTVADYTGEETKLTDSGTRRILIPQVIKAQFRDMDTDFLIGPKNETKGERNPSGTTGKMGTPVEFTAPEIPSYVFDHYEYSDSRNDKDKGREVGAKGEKKWSGKTNTQKQGIIFFYKKQSPKLTLSKKADKNDYYVGEKVSYNLVLENIGDVSLTNMKLVDKIPTGLSKPTNIKLEGTALKEGKLAGGTSGQYYTWNNSTRELSVFSNTLGKGSLNNKVLTYDTIVEQGTKNETKTNTATLSGDNDVSKPTAQATINILGDLEPLLSLTKKADKTDYYVGDTASYELSMSNRGKADLTDMKLVDKVPTGMAKPTNVKLGTALLKEGASTGGALGQYYTWNNTTNELTVYSKKLAIGETIKVTYESKIGQGTSGELKKNIALLDGKNAPSKPTADATIKILEKKEPEFTLTKKANKKVFTIGENVSYSLNLKNDSKVDLKDPKLTDVFPQGLMKPESVFLNGRKIDEGQDKISANGEYFTWEGKTLTVYFKELKINETVKIDYNTALTAGTAGDKKKNTAILSGSNTTNTATAEETIELVETVLANLKAEKYVDKGRATVRDTVRYEVNLLNNGNTALNKAVVTDYLPQGYDRPKNIRLDGVPIPEGASRPGDNGLYYVWNDTEKYLKIYYDTHPVNNKKKLTYDVKILTGNVDEEKRNTVYFKGDNSRNEASAIASVKIINKFVTLHVKQEVINKHGDIVVPTTGYMTLDNIKRTNTSDLKDQISFEIPSYEANTNQVYKDIKLKWDGNYSNYLPKLLTPEFYNYDGYQITTNNRDHNYNDRKNEQLPDIDMLDQEEYWLTVYIQPKAGEDGPPFYNWDYQVNDFGKIKSKDPFDWNNWQKDPKVKSDYKSGSFPAENSYSRNGETTTTVKLIEPGDTILRYEDYGRSFGPYVGAEMLYPYIDWDPIMETVVPNADKWQNIPKGATNQKTNEAKWNGKMSAKGLSTAAMGGSPDIHYIGGYYYDPVPYEESVPPPNHWNYDDTNPYPYMEGRRNNTKLIPLVFDFKDDSIEAVIRIRMSMNATKINQTVYTLSTRSYYVPQVIKVQFRDVDTDEQIKPQEIVGKGGKYKDPQNITAPLLSGYSFQNYEYFDNKKVHTVARPGENTYRGELTTTKKGIIFWYKK